MFNVDTDDLLRPYQEVFTDGLGALKGVTAKFYVDENIKPRYCKPRPTSEGGSRTRSSEGNWSNTSLEYYGLAAPIVSVLKSTGAIRICGDYKVTINQAVKVDKYPNPTNTQSGQIPKSEHYICSQN